MNVVRGVASAAVGALLVALQAGAVMPPAHAADGPGISFDVAGDGRGFVDDPAGPLLTTDLLAPGYSATGDVRIRNDSADVAELVVQATDVRNDDHGCVRPEIRVGDTSCGVDGGELASWLELTITKDAGSTAARELWSGSIEELVDGATLTDGMEPGAVWSLRMTAHLPRAAGNETQTDRIGFDLRWTASADTGDTTTDILGTEVTTGGTGSSGPGSEETGSGADVLGVELPLTGATVDLRVLLLALTALFAGVALLLSARLRAVPAPVRHRRTWTA